MQLGRGDEVNKQVQMAIHAQRRDSLQLGLGARFLFKAGYWCNCLGLSGVLRPFLSRAQPSVLHFY
jgi:hypothetical protein